MWYHPVVFMWMARPVLAASAGPLCLERRLGRADFHELDDGFEVAAMVFVGAQCGGHFDGVAIGAHEELLGAFEFDALAHGFALGVGAALGVVGAGVVAAHEGGAGDGEGGLGLGDGAATQDATHLDPGERIAGGYDFFHYLLQVGLNVHWVGFSCTVTEFVILAGFWGKLSFRSI